MGYYQLLTRTPVVAAKSTPHMYIGAGGEGFGGDRGIGGEGVEGGAGRRDGGRGGGGSDSSRELNGDLTCPTCLI